MRRSLIRIILLTLIQFSLSNCAYVYSKSDNVAVKVKELANLERYGLALETLSFIEPTHFNYVFLMSEKKRISILADNYEEKALKQASKYAKGKNWADALSIYDEALGNIPNSKKLKNARTKFIIKRDNYLKQLKNKLLVSNAKTLSNKTATTKEIALVNPNDTKAKNILSSHIREVKLTAQKLITCAEDGINNNDTQLAEECLSLASNLSTSDVTNKKIKRLKKKIVNEKKLRRKSHKKSIKKIGKTLAQVKTTTELIRYKNEILTLYQQDKSNKKIIKLKKELESRIDKELNTGIKEGQILYSQGRIQQALNRWNELQQLSPKNVKLNDYIHRAERVLKKLHSLSESPNTVSPQRIK